MMVPFNKWFPAVEKGVKRINQKFKHNNGQLAVEINFIAHCMGYSLDKLNEAIDIDTIPKKL